MPDSEDQELHSSSYARLSEDQKGLADAILGFLNGQNTKVSERILYALIDEIGYYSTITS